MAGRLKLGPAGAEGRRHFQISQNGAGEERNLEPTHKTNVGHPPSTATSMLRPTKPKHRRLLC